MCFVITLYQAVCVYACLWGRQVFHHYVVFDITMNLIAYDVKFDLMVKVMSARFLYYERTILLFVINQYFLGRYFNAMQISCFSSYFHPLISASINGS